MGPEMRVGGDVSFSSDLYHIFCVCVCVFRSVRMWAGWEVYAVCRGGYVRWNAEWRSGVKGLR
jgi:hypothetical protein